MWVFNQGTCERRQSEMPLYSVQCTVYIEGLFQITFTVPLSQIPFSSRMLKSLKFHCQFKLFWKINKGIESLPQTLNL